MKTLLKILYALLAIILIFCALIGISGFNPGMTQSIMDALNLNQESQVERTATRRSEPVVQKEETGEKDREVDSEGGREDSGNEPDRNGAGEQEGTVSGAQAGGTAPDLITEYEAPDEADLSIPENVAQYTGYEEPHGDIGEIADNDADRIEQELGTGATGDGLDFDPLMYPYYSMLNDEGKHIYRQIFANVNELNPVFRPVEQASEDVIGDAFLAVANDHPELFWLNAAYAGFRRRNGACVEIDLSFNRTADQLEREKEAFDNAAAGIVSAATGSDYEKEKFVHNALMDRLSYAHNDLDQSAYSAIVNDVTVCAGYSRSFQYIMQELGIPCYLCAGYAGEPHGWNIIKLEDDFYNVDVTWDDTGEERYAYFNKTDTDYGTSHIRKDLSIYLPPCNGEKYRNLEAEEGTGQDGQKTGQEPRGLSDLGMTEEDVIYTISDSYDYCYEKMASSGLGDYTFYAVLDNENLYSDCLAAYNSGYTKEAFGRRAAQEAGAVSFYEIKTFAEEIEGGRYLITHKVSIR